MEPESHERDGEVMSGGVNKVILVGNLGKDPEVRFIGNGGAEASAVCTLRLAVNERRKDGDNWKDHVEWMDVVVFGANAENCGKFLAKGRQIYVEGRLQTRTYKDKSGADRWRTEVIAQHVNFLGGGQGQQSSGPATRPAAGSSSWPADSSGGTAAGADQGGFIDDDLPF